MTDVVIVSAARTAIGSFGGVLSSIAAHELGATVIRAALDRAAIDAADVSDVVLGHVLTAGQGQNTARQAAIRAGIPVEKAALTINQVCGSGLRAVALGYQAIKAGDATIVVAGGQENMSLSAHSAHLRNGTKMGAVEFVDTMIKDGLWDAFNGYHIARPRRMSPSFFRYPAPIRTLLPPRHNRRRQRPRHPENSRTRSFRSPFTPARATLSSTPTSIQKHRPPPRAWRSFALHSARAALSPQAMRPVLTTVHR
jgi:Thiolase, N-terminal domain